MKTVIAPSGGWRAIDFREIWRYRELLYFLTMRDIRVRYKQTALGLAWAILQPLLTMLIFSLFFGRFAKLPSDGKPYALFTLAALIPWQLFSYALTQSSNSLVAEQRLITKVYFPRIIVPLASVLSGIVDFAVALFLMVGLMLAMGYYPTLSFLAVIPLTVFTVLTALSVGVWLSALNVQYRDVRYTLPFLAQVWMFASPVAYSASIVPKEWRWLYGLNPMAGVIEAFRWAILGTSAPDWGLITLSAVTVAVLLFGGLFYFRRLETKFADIV